MFTSPEQFAAATKKLFELQMTTFNALASKAVDGVEQVLALNMAAAKNSVQGSMAAGKDIVQAKDPKAALDAAAWQAQPAMNGAVEYGEQLKTIINDIHKEFTDAANRHMAEAQTALSALIYDVTRDAKPESDNAVYVVKAAINNAFRGYEEVANATRDAVKLVEQEVAKATALVNGAGKGRKRP